LVKPRICIFPNPVAPLQALPHFLYIYRKFAGMEELLDQEVQNLPPPEKESSPWSIFLGLILTMLLGFLLGGVAAEVLARAYHTSLPELMGGLSNGSTTLTRNLVRLGNFFPHLFAFTGGSIAIIWYVYRQKWIDYFQLRQWPSPLVLGLSILCITATFFVAQTTYWINQNLPLPAGMLEMEEDANALIKQLLVMNSPWELLLNLLVVGVAPALGEELVFRGVIQQQAQRLSKNPHVAIWITAILFSAIHFQFAGFLPRMVLGGVLGYLFWWSGNLWLPIIGHFLFNSLQVVAYYFVGDKVDAFSPDAKVEEPGWLLGILGAICLIAIARVAKNLFNPSNPRA
jgi:uncharacterized protein